MGDWSWLDVEPAAGTRRFTRRRKVRLGDVRPDGRLRLDALARYTQDVSDDDTTDAGLNPRPAWVVRRTAVAVLASARLGEELELTTFCSGLGRRWAERHIRVVGAKGGRYEVSTLWICIDPASGRPRELTGQFRSIYAASAGGRTVTARLTHPKPPAAAATRVWPLRAVDIDVYGHVNNAAYWAVVEQALAGADEPEPFRTAVEYGAGVDRADEVIVAEHGEHGVRHLWWLTGPEGAATVAATAAIEPGAAPPKGAAPAEGAG